MNAIQESAVGASRRSSSTLAAKSFFLSFMLAVLATSAAAAELLPIEKQVAERVSSSKPTVVHFWAPWCSNCYAELKNKGWSNFIEANPLKTPSRARAAATAGAAGSSSGR